MPRVAPQRSRLPTPAVPVSGGSAVRLDHVSFTYPGRQRAACRLKADVTFKATEGTTYTNPSFTPQYNGSYNIGMIRGAYHFTSS